MKNLMLYTLFALLLMSGGVKTQAQEYVPMIQEGNEWYTLDAQVCSPQPLRGYNTLVHRIADDTLIGGVRYTKVMQTVNDVGTPTLASLLREEDGKVWERYLYGSTEVLLYDFTANLDDSLVCGYGDYFVLDSISIEQIGGVDRKKFWFGLEYDFIGDPYAMETWIEGIGSDVGLLFCGSYYFCGGYYRALCFHQNGELVWQNPEYDACLITDVKEIHDDELTLYPNPANNLIHINGVEAAEVQVYNALGQLVKTVQGSNAINVSGLADGVYLLRVTDEDGRSYMARVVVK